MVKKKDVPIAVANAAFPPSEQFEHERIKTRRLDYQHAAGFEKPVYLPQVPGRVRDVFDDMQHHHSVESAVRQRRVGQHAAACLSADRSLER